MCAASLYDQFVPLVAGTPMVLGDTDRLLCDRIERSALHPRHNPLRIGGLFASFETEFFVESLGRTMSLEHFSEMADPSRAEAIGYNLVKTGGPKIEARSLPSRDSDGHDIYLNQPGSIYQYFECIGELDQQAARSPGFYFYRDYDHVHFSLMGEDASQVRNVDPNFIRLFEASLIAHLQAARPLLLSAEQLTATRPEETDSYINRIGARNDNAPGVIADLECFVVRRENPQDHHYELRCTYPGPDGRLSVNHMLVAHALLTASLDMALAAREDPALEHRIMQASREAQSEQHACACGLSFPNVIGEMRASPILNDERSFGPDLTKQLAHCVAAAEGIDIGKVDMIAGIGQLPKQIAPGDSYDHTHLFGGGAYGAPQIQRASDGRQERNI